MADQEKPASGELIVALTPDGQNIVINHPDLKPDAEGCGHIIFSPDQAMRLATLLWKKACIARGIVCAHCGDFITEEGGWATAQFRYCFKEECQQEFYKEAQAMIRAVDPETADRLAAATRKPMATASFKCPKCRRVSYNPNDIAQKYCGSCHLFFGELEIGLHL
jgi:hypothetical protein